VLTEVRLSLGLWVTRVHHRGKQSDYWDTVEREGVISSVHMITWITPPEC